MTENAAQNAPLTGKTVAFLATNGVEQVELTSPWEAVIAAGATPVLVSPESGTITAMQSDWDHGESFEVNTTVKDAKAEDEGGTAEDAEGKAGADDEGDDAAGAGTTAYTEDEQGLLVPAGDAPALTAALDALLADPGRRRALGAAGPTRARAFAASSVAQQVLAAYDAARPTG